VHRWRVVAAIRQMLSKHDLRRLEIAFVNEPSGFGQGRGNVTRLWSLPWKSALVLLHGFAQRYGRGFVPGGSRNGRPRLLHCAPELGLQIARRTVALR